MNKVWLIVGYLYLFGCAKKSAHPPVGGFLTEKDMKTSQNRIKSLNSLERYQIEQWIDDQSDSYYPMGLNYWTSIPQLKDRPRKKDGTTVSYSYWIYDFDWTKLYQDPVEQSDVILGTFEEIKAVEDALRYMQVGEETTLLIPSVLAFGTYGDNDKIPHDMPIIVKLKILK